MVILVVEDDKVAQTLLVDQLTTWGHQVLKADNGRTAWSILEASRELDDTDVAFIDWELPELTGVQLCRNVQSLLPESRPFLFMVTIRDRPEDIRLALEAGADDYIAKPFDPTVLRARLASATRRLEVEKGKREMSRLRGSMETAHWAANEISQPLTSLRLWIDMLSEEGEALAGKIGGLPAGFTDTRLEASIERLTCLVRRLRQDTSFESQDRASEPRM